MNWDEFEARAPDLAATARELLVDADVALLGTLRRDGAPRISCVQPCILEGALYLGMMWRSRKAVDLAREAGSPQRDLQQHGCGGRAEPHRADGRDD